jgi:orotidine-5'-phosphate decarboxylase
MPFIEKIEKMVMDLESHLCIGLDPDLDHFPASIPKTPAGVEQFLREIVEATMPFACVYKPNFAFFGSLGEEGIAVLHRIMQLVQKDRPVILDAKFGDIGNTARHYARLAFDVLGTDAVTLNPYLGLDSLAPFLERKESFSFILGITSNPGSEEIQKRRLADGKRVFEELAERLEENFPQPNWGWVVGATQIKGMQSLRTICPNRWFLIPGVGAQAGELGRSLAASRSPAGTPLALVNASRSILYASHGSDYQEAAGKAAESTVKEMRRVLGIAGRGA